MAVNPYREGESRHNQWIIQNESKEPEALAMYALQQKGNGKIARLEDAKLAAKLIIKYPQIPGNRLSIRLERNNQEFEMIFDREVTWTINGMPIDAEDDAQREECIRVGKQIEDILNRQLVVPDYDDYVVENLERMIAGYHYDARKDLQSLLNGPIDDRGAGI